jgi:hypothetical protein
MCIGDLRSLELFVACVADAVPAALDAVAEGPTGSCSVSRRCEDAEADECATPPTLAPE